MVATDSLKAHISNLDEKNGKLQAWVIVLAVASLIASIVQIVVALRAPDPVVNVAAPVIPAPVVNVTAPVVNVIAPPASASGPKRGYGKTG